VLYESLFKPLEPELWGIKDIIIIPDGELAKIPFESFVVANKEQGKPVYLLEKYRIKYIQGASTLSILRKHYRRQNSSKHFIGFGDPVYDYENFQQGKPENGSPGTSKGDIVKEIHRDKYNREGGMYTRLPGSGQEVETIAELFKQQEQKSVVYLRESATEERAKSSDLREFDYIHFSCHGILGDGFQSLILSQTPGSKEDGYLTLNEIMNCDYQAKLVVLSACQTGTGKMERAEGVMGLTRAVMYAGTPAVVASLWNVSEMGTKELMVKFYTNMLEKGMNKEEDLRQAKLEMIKGNKYASPYFWSSFVMYGE
jgi:CHAT domain-containing protein